MLTAGQLEKEERLVAELEVMGIRYLSRLTATQVRHLRSPQQMLTDLVKQPSSRVRTAVIAIFLLHPDFCEALPGALDGLSPQDQQTLKFFYTAAVYLQRKHDARLQLYVGDRWRQLPDLFQQEFSFQPQASPDELLRQLGIKQREQTGIVANWAGTYENVAHHLLRSWELGQKWSQ
jgi:hypothetical protein